MNKFLVATLSIGALTIGVAQAADMRAPAYKAPAPAPVAYNWTGCYLGAGGGYGMWNQEVSVAIGGAPTGVSNDNGGRGWFGTVQVGCDYQFGSNIVIGAFGDYDFSGIKGDMSIAALGHVGEEKHKSTWAAGGRMGWLPFQQLLVFVSGGYTEARFDQVATRIAVNGNATGSGILKHTYSGWFLGSGYEYNIGWLPGLYWKSEYRYADYGSDTLQYVTLATGAPTGTTINSDKRMHTVRSELVWRFNFGRY